MSTEKCRNVNLQVDLVERALPSVVAAAGTSDMAVGQGGGGVIRLSFSPYEIKTLRLRLSGGGTGDRSKL